MKVRFLFLIFIATASLLFWQACQDISSEKNVVSNGIANFDVQAMNNTTTVRCGIGCNLPTISSQMTYKSCSNNQEGFECFSWQNFISLNWVASRQDRGQPDTNVEPKDFGAPGDFRPTVWESYLDFEEVFRPELPAPWKEYDPDSIKIMQRLAKDVDEVLPPEIIFDEELEDAQPREIIQASGEWLTTQDSQLVWYEVKMNEDQYNFINDNKLYDPREQLKYAEKHQGIWLPSANSTKGQEAAGTIEIKAAWKVIPKEKLEEQTPFYKISKAWIPKVEGFDQDGDPIYGKHSLQHIGLVGLHIIRKLEAAQQFVWMTFEHRHNAPTEPVDPDDPTDYSFYNPQDTTTPNISPIPNKTPLEQPTQVTRIRQNTLSDNVIALNQAMHDSIRAINPNSVWQHYDLINVQWPTSSVNDRNNNGGITPLVEGGITPTNIANITMETYIQGKDCISCHKNASIVNLDPNNPKRWATDYSFNFARAEYQVKE